MIINYIYIHVCVPLLEWDVHYLEILCSSVTYNNFVRGVDMSCKVGG